MTKKAYAKVNIFLKIVGKKDGFHLLKSRFMIVKNLYDTIMIKPKTKSDEFVLEGDFGCETKQNSIYKIYKELQKFPQVKEFFQTHKVVVDKKIPEFAGLGGGSSDAGAFLNLCNQVCNLNLSLQERIDIGKKIGSDVAFFITEYPSANVSGFGEIVQKFDEEALDIKTLTPPIQCSTPKVYQEFAKKPHYDKNLADELWQKPSKEILQTYKKEKLNDLLIPAQNLYHDIKNYFKPNSFFSGSGSTIFWINNKNISK